MKLKYVPTFESFINERFKEDPEYKDAPVTVSFTVTFMEGKKEWYGLPEEGYTAPKKLRDAYQDNPDESPFLNKKTTRDYQAAVKQIDAFIKKNKIKGKPKYFEPTMDSPGIIRLALVEGDLPDREGRTNLRPLMLQLGNLETAQERESSNLRLGLDVDDMPAYYGPY
jgi:hypothetical protein